MSIHFFRTLGLSLLVISLSTFSLASSLSPKTIPAPVIDLQSSTKEKQTAVFAGGCFWGVEGVFRHIKGVSNVVSGFSGGNAATAHYEIVSSGQTNHAETVKITYDPSKVSYGQLLQVFFAVAHDPTQLNRQGPDTGRQYRSVIFFTNKEQEKVAKSYITQLNKAHVFPSGIVTEVVPFQAFYPAEKYHQNFLATHPDYPYIVVHDLPKLEQLKKQFPNLFQL
jgi:peptide-methionine (S)-S-oxide reductase